MNKNTIKIAVGIICFPDGEYGFAVPDIPNCEIPSHSLESGMEQIYKLVPKHIKELIEKGCEIKTSSIEELSTQEEFDQFSWMYIEFELPPKPYSIYLPEHVINALKETAQQQGLSENAMLEKIIKHYLTWFQSSKQTKPIVPQH